MNNDELIAAGHELAKCLDSNTPLLDIAKLLSKMATQLDVTTEALREKTKQCDAEHNDVLAWEKTMFKVCGEDGTKSVAEKFASLEASRAALAAENAALKVAISQHAAGFTVCEACGEENVSGNDDVCRALNETPATDAFLRELRAQGVEMFAAHCQKRRSEMMKTEPNEPAINQAITATRRSGELALWFAAQLRQGGAA